MLSTLLASPGDATTSSTILSSAMADPSSVAKGAFGQVVIVAVRESAHPLNWSAMIKLIGLSGGIGSGKSTVAAMIRERGIPVLDADAIARQVVEPGLPAYQDIARAWPEVLRPDGGIDRKKLAGIVFSDPASQARLEAMTHPRIRAEVAAQSHALAVAGHRLAFLEAALLVETGFYKQLDGLVVVTVSLENQVARVMARDNCPREAALARIAAQRPMAEKVAVADHVIHNDGSLDEARAQLAAVLVAL